MGSLYYNDLGGVSGSTIQLQHKANFALFNNFQPYRYWSSTLWTPVRTAHSAFRSVMVFRAQMSSL
jgi:hypothetical protein